MGLDLPRIGPPAHGRGADPEEQRDLPGREDRVVVEQAEAEVRPEGLEELAALRLETLGLATTKAWVFHGILLGL